MRHFTVVFKTNDFARELPFPAALQFEVQDFSFNVLGGPESCTIVAKSADTALLRDLLYHLRAPVDVYDENGTWVWGGFLFESSVQIGGVTRTVSLENYFNAVRVAYAASGGTAYTDWAYDATGLADYGRKELQETGLSSNPTSAAAYRDLLLAQYSKIVPAVSVATSNSDQATLTCKGWKDTLSWRYYECAALGLSYWPNPMVNMDTVLGVASNRSHAVAQPLTTNGAYAFDSVIVTLFHSGGFPFPITVSLYEVDGAKPNTGTLRATKTLAETAVVWGDNTFYFPAPLYVWPITHQFFLIISVTTDSPSQAYYYRMDTAVNGSVQVQNNEDFSIWSSASPQFSIIYKLHGVLPNETRIANAIASHATFITGSDTIASGLNTDTYVAGGSTLQAVLDGLLEQGTSNNLRLLYTVTPERRFRMFQEPSGDASSATLMLTREGKLRNRFGDEIGAANPCGQFALFWDEVPAILTGVTRNPDLSCFFIEEATYNVAEDAWSPVARGAVKPFDIFGLQKQ